MIQFSICDPYLFRALAALCREGDDSPVRRQERRIEYVPVALVLLAQQPGFARFGIDAKKPASMGLPMPGGHQKCPPPVHASDGAARRIAHQEQFFSRRIRCESGRCQVPAVDLPDLIVATDHRSEEHTSELQSLMRISYAVF